MLGERGAGDVILKYFYFIAESAAIVDLLLLAMF